MTQAARHFLAGLQDEGVGAGRRGFEQAKLLVIDPRVVGQLAQVTAQQCQVVLVIDPANAPQAVRCCLVIKLANQCITGVGGHGGNTAALDQVNGLLEQTRGRIVRMNFK